MAADSVEWYFNEDGSLSVNDTCQSVFYHPNLNTILVITKEPAVKVIDVNSGSLLQKSTLSAETGSQIHAAYIPKYDRLLFTDGKAIGLRKDHCGMLLLDTMLQVPISKPDDIVKIELPFAEALKLLKCLFSVHLPGMEATEEFTQELDKNIIACQATTKKNHKLAKWCTVCLQLPYSVIKSVCSHMVQELKRVNRLVPALAIASAVNERLVSLLSTNTNDQDLLHSSSSGSVDRTQMYSEAARKETFKNWPHMTYKWALPDQMAQAGFYHQPNSTGDDRALCFTCNVCLVCWEPTDEPWSEHERHSPSCPFVKGEYTQNVPLSVSYATSPAQSPGERMEQIHCLSTSSCLGLMATATRSGQIMVWDVRKQLKKILQFCIDPTDSLLFSKRLDHVRYDDAHFMTMMEAWGEGNSQTTKVSGSDDDVKIPRVQSTESKSDSIEDDDCSVEELLQTFRPSRDVQTHKICVIGASDACDNNSQPGPAVVIGLSVRNCDFGLPAPNASSANSNIVQALNDVNQSSSQNGPLDIMKLDQSFKHSTYSRQQFIPFILVYDIRSDYPSRSKTTANDDLSDVQTRHPDVPSDKSQPSTSFTINDCDNTIVFSDSFCDEIWMKSSDDELKEFVCDSDDDDDFKLNVSSANSAYPVSISPHVNPMKKVENSKQKSQESFTNQSLPTFNKSKAKEPPSEGLLRQCIELPDEFNNENYYVNEIVPSFNGKHLIVSITYSGISDLKVISATSNHSTGAILIYQINFNSDLLSLNEVPVVVRQFTNIQDNITSLLVLPFHATDIQLEDSPPHEACEASPKGFMVATTVYGKLVVFRLRDLRAVGEFNPKKDEKFISITYLSSINRICACTEIGTLCFLQLCQSGLINHDKDVGESQVDGLVSKKSQSYERSKELSDNFKDDSFESPVKTESFLINEPFTSENIKALNELIQFENLTPRFSVTVPPCWTEIQQEQKQRRHPQHLQQQGETVQHTSSWRLQSDSMTWDEHVFELSLSRPCSIGHIDFKFNLHLSLVSPLPKIEVTLLKQISGSMCRQMNYSRTSDQCEAVDSPIDFNIKPEVAGKSENSPDAEERPPTFLNPVVTESYLENHNAEILCGPVDLGSCIDQSGQSGIVTLTSPELLNTKCQTFLLHIKALNVDKEFGSKAEAKSPVENKQPQKKLKALKSKAKLSGTVPTLQAMLDQFITPGSTVDRLATNVANKNIDLKGCDRFHEVSISIRRTKKTNIPHERSQRFAILETPSFHHRLILAACGVNIPDRNANYNEIQHTALDTLIWVAAIQMNTAHSSFKANLLTQIEENLTLLISSCIVQGNRTIARKCCKLLVLCMEDDDAITDDDSLTVLFKYSLLQSLISCLDKVFLCQSSGALRWFFLLLNRVKYLDVTEVGKKVLGLLSSISEQLQLKNNSFHLLLRSRFGLYGTPFDPELFEFQPPVPQKPTSTVLTYAGVVAGCNSIPSNGNGNQSSQNSKGKDGFLDSLDFRDLLNLPTEKNNLGRLSWLPQNQQMIGLMEVEPIHFVCHATSDGTRMEKMDTGSNNVVGASSLLPMSGNSWHEQLNYQNPISNDVIQTTKTLAQALKGGPGYPLYNSLLSSYLQKKTELLELKKQKQKMEQKLTDNPNSSNLPIIVSSPSSSNAVMGYQPTPTPKTTPLFMTPPLTPPSENNLLGNPDSELSGPPVVKLVKPSVAAKDTKTNDIPLNSSPWQHLLQLPPQNMLVIERMHSGARRFVVLDFGRPILLTDLMIPSCPELVSLSVDVWVQSEEVDGQRLTVSTDIGTRSLVISDLQPPAYCQYLKITIIGRYGMSTTQCRIPMGYFYGYTFILPWEKRHFQISDLKKESNNVEEWKEKSKSASLLQAQVTMLSALQEDIHCRYSLACNKLQTLLQPYLYQESGNPNHTHYRLHNKDKTINNEDKKIYHVYDECIQLQQQLNLICQAIIRLQTSESTRGGNMFKSDTILQNMCSDKLQVIANSLLDTLIGLTCSSAATPCIPQSLSNSFDLQLCSSLFKNLCMNTTCPTQLNASTLLVRMSANQPWWGSFLASTFQSLFSSNNSSLFPQDRIFILLTYLGQKSLSSTGCTNVLESFLDLLCSSLDAVPQSQGINIILRGLLDLPYVGWILLFLSSCLDTMENISGIAFENDASNTSKKTNRWTFIQGENTSRKSESSQNKSSSSSKSLRRKLQKRLMHHKQKIEDLESTKKAFPTSTMPMAPFTSDICESIKAAIKQQEEAFSKTINKQQFKNYHEVQKSVAETTNKEYVGQAESSGQTADQEIDERKTVLNYKVCLKVAQRLIALLLHMDFSSSIDLMLLVCKVIAKVVMMTKPNIALSSLITDEQLLQLLITVVQSHEKKFSVTSGHQWISHAITCLLLDILEGECKDLSKPDTSASNSVISDEMKDAVEQKIHILAPESLINSTPGSSGLKTTSSVDSGSYMKELPMLLDTDESSDEGNADLSNPTEVSESLDEKPLYPPKFTSTSVSKKTSYWTGLYNAFKQSNSQAVKECKSQDLLSFPSTTSLSPQLISSAMDCRLEQGVEIAAELRLKFMSSVELDTLHTAINSNLPTMVDEYLDEENTIDLSSQNLPLSGKTSVEMLSSCFDYLFAQLRSGHIDIESLLTLWICLNSERSNVPIIPLSSSAIASLLSALAWKQTISLRVWCLFFQCLTMSFFFKFKNASSDAFISALLGDPNFLAILIKFLSGSSLANGPNSSKTEVGPLVDLSFHDFLLQLQLHSYVISPDNAQGTRIKEMLLKIVQQLVAPNGPIFCGQGPLDVQLSLINTLLRLSFDHIDVNIALSVVESVSALACNYIVNSNYVNCCRHVEKLPSASSCFGGLLANVFKSSAVSDRDKSASNSANGVSRDSLVCAILQLASIIVKSQLKTSNNETNPPSASFNFENSSSQTDEHKTAHGSQNPEPGCSHFSSESKVKIPCVADIILSHQCIIDDLLTALSKCSAASMAMILGFGSEALGSGITPDVFNFVLDSPLSVGDGVFNLLYSMNNKASNIDLILQPVYRWLSSSLSTQGINASPCVLSEPLIWFTYLILDCPTSLAKFHELGGIKLIAENLVCCHSSLVNSNPSLVSIIMQHLVQKNQSTAAAASANPRSSSELNSLSEGLLNFAPLGTITSSNPTAQPADNLIRPSAPHPRSRTPAWAYQFYPAEKWVDLTITLPCAILLHEIQIQPHLTSLATCPSAVSVDAGCWSSTLTPICNPQSTSGLTFVRLLLSKPEILTKVCLRLHKPTDSSILGLSHILLIGSTTFNESYAKLSTQSVPSEEIIARSSLGWLRVLHHCLTMPSNNDLYMSAISDVPGLLESCCSLLQTPGLSIYLSHIEKVLLIIGQHSHELGLSIINTLLRHCSWTLQYDYVSTTNFDNIIPASDAIVDILHTLCTISDDSVYTRVEAVLKWLNNVLREVPPVGYSPESLPSTSPSYNWPNSLSPSYIHCIATILWHCHEQQANENIANLLESNLVYSLCDLSLRIENVCLRQALDSILCSICFINPDFFQLVLYCFGLTDTSFNSLTDHQKNLGISSLGNTDTDDFKEAKHFSLQDFHIKQLTPNKLSSLAVICQSPPIFEQLLDCGFMSMLVQIILDFCHHQLTKKSVVDDASSTSAAPDFDEAENTSLPDSKKCFNQELVISILKFFTKVASNGIVQDWLGGNEGSSWWLPLLSVLCNKSPSTSHSSSVFVLLFGNDPSCYGNQSSSHLEDATVKFLSTCCWCHPQNQQLIAEVLCQIICKEKISRPDNSILGISGFTRRIILQLLLENEKILVYVKSPASIPLHKPPATMLGDGGLGFLHPQFSCGHNVRTVYVSTQTTCSDIISSITDIIGLTSSPSSSTTPNNKDEVAEENGLDDNKELTKQDIEFKNHLLTAGTLAKYKRQKDIANSQTAAKPAPRRTSSGLDPLPIPSMGKTVTSRTSLALFHEQLPEQLLPDELTLAQLLLLLQERGQSLSTPYITLNITNKKEFEKSKKSHDREFGEIPHKVLLESKSLSTTLQIFASIGGLSILAQHLPLLYPEISLQISPKPPSEMVSGNSKSVGSIDSDWVKVEDIIDEFQDFFPPGSSSVSGPCPTSMQPTSIPPYSLAAFGLFLRLPGYAEVLLKEKQKAQCLLRLSLGVTDDADGSDIFSSNFDPSLPTLPFSVLRQLFDATPLTTDDGLLLRKMALEVGAIHLLLACLSVLSHQSSDIVLPGLQNDSILAAAKAGSKGKNGSAKTDDKSHLYWAKGTGFGTGSTAQSWDVEQHILRQKLEEEHVTCLLLVLASYIDPKSDTLRSEKLCDDDPAASENASNDLIPPFFLELLRQSCLLAALSSYLRNDSVLDMARHIPLYQSLLKLLRAIASTPLLVPLLLPQEDSGSSSEMSICYLLSQMKCCVDTYLYRLRSNKMKLSASKGKVKKSANNKEEIDDETGGLTLLITDIQETASIVSFASQSLNKEDGADGNNSTYLLSLSVMKNANKSVEEQYMDILKPLQFELFEMIVEDDDGIRFTVPYHFESNMRNSSEHGHPSRARRIAQETVTLSTSLPLSFNSSVFVRCDQDRLDVMKMLITGPSDTPYANGCFEFDVFFPPDYPNSPMLINLETTGHHTVRFNPNLYNDGKVCLSILNTWHGRPEEKWNSNTSSFLQVLVSIQSLILVADPYFNEPGYERSRGTASGNQSSREYDANIRQATVKWGILEQLRNPSSCFKSIIHSHMWMKRGEIIRQCEAWIADMESFTIDRRSIKTINLNIQALKRHTAQLKEEFAKMKPPEGLDNWTEEMTSCKVGTMPVNNVTKHMDKSKQTACMNGDLCPEEAKSSKSLLGISKMDSIDLGDEIYNLPPKNSQHDDDDLIDITSPTEASNYIDLSEPFTEFSTMDNDLSEDKESIC